MLGVNTANGPTPIPIKPKLILPVLVTTFSGTHRLPGYSGEKVIGIVQVVFTGLTVAPFMVQPLIVPTEYSCLPPCDCGTVMLVIVSVAVVASKTLTGELLEPIFVFWKLLVEGDISRMRLLIASAM